jgi:hypothetical protein
LHRCVELPHRAHDKRSGPPRGGGANSGAAANTGAASGAASGGNAAAPGGGGGGGAAGAGGAGGGGGGGPNKGGGGGGSGSNPADEVADQASASEGQFAADIEDAANTYFQKIYTGQMTIVDVIALLQSFKTSASTREQEIFACMIHNVSVRSLRACVDAPA